MRRFAGWALVAAAALPALSGASEREAEAAPLVAAVAERLTLARAVAQTKWDSGQAVEDPSREREVLARAVGEGGPLGLDEGLVRTFFSDQILANKLVQYHLLAQWRREGGRPAGASLDLASRVRPELDRLQRVLLEQLAHLAELRHSAGCAVTLARATGDYADSHQFDEGWRSALDLALSRFCSAPG